jgi:hypothetical protein
MTFATDLIVRNARGSTIAFVEIKNLQGLSRDLAIGIRHDLIEYGWIPAQAPYFLLLSQDVGFLWKEPKTDDLDLPPTYEFAMTSVVDRYLDKDPGRRLYGEELEWLVLEWLLSLAGEVQPEAEEPERTLARSGFNDSIKGAAVLFGDAA